MIAEEKKTLRRYWKQVPPPADYRERSEKILKFLSRHEAVREATHIGLYSPFPWEPDLIDLWNQFPGKVCFPKIEKVETGIRFHKIASLSDLKSGYSRIPEPPSTAPLITWQKGDLILLPGLCYDKRGIRLGSGKGYYDRFLAKQDVDIKIWGVTFEERIVVQALPREAHDIAMQRLVTENGLITPTAS